MKKLKIMFMLAFVSSSFLQAQSWQSIGPLNRTGPGGATGQGSGLINAVTFHPKYNTADASIGGAINKTLFVGSPFGGLWISRNDGVNWSNTDPLGQYTNLSTDLFRGCGVVDIQVDYVTPTTLYACFSASEYADGFSALSMNNTYPSTGIYKYTPATGWVAKVSYPYQSNKSVSSLTISPSSSSTIFACTTDGVIRSTDGGTTWSAPLATEGTNKPFRSLVFDPTNTSIAFASGRDVYRSLDGGNTFTSISNFTPMIPDISGSIMLTNIAVISSTSVYARVFYTNTSAIKTERFFHYNGSTWTMLSQFPSVIEYHYDKMPMLAKKVGTTEYVFAGSDIVNLYNSTSATWTTLSSYNVTMHANIHDIDFSPDGTVLIATHDGGVSKATSNFYTTPAWVTINTGLNIASLYSFAGAQKNADLILTGEKYNGNSVVKNATSGSPTWSGYDVDHGGDKMISWENPNEWYDRQTQYGGSPIYRNSTGNEALTYSGANQIFTTASISPPLTAPNHAMFEEFSDKKPLAMDPNNPNVVYWGSNLLIRSMDKGATSQVIFRKSDCFETGTPDLHSHINTIVIAPSNSNYLYINCVNPYSFETFTSHIYKTANASDPTYAAACPHSASEGVVCGNWQDITPPFGSSSKKSVINAIAVSDKDPNLIWAGFNYNPNLTNFVLWKYDGTTWTDYGQGLPANTSITSLVYEKGSNDCLYAGTDIAGVFYRKKNMAAWLPYGTGLPHALDAQMEVNNSENMVRVGTVGRGIWKTTLSCPTAPFTSPNPCNECNSPTDYFWEGTNVTIINTTLTINKHFVRAVDYIDVLPNTTLTASSTAYYDLFIHGCGPTQKNSYRKNTDDENNDQTIHLDGEQENNVNGIAVFPNPNNGIFTLNTGNMETKDVYVYDILGKVVYQKNKTAEKTLNINITDAPKGMYMIKVISANKTETIKIINQ